MSEFHPAYIFNGILFAVAGIALFLVCFGVLTRLIPIPLWKEIIENKNMALAVLVGAMLIALGSIIAAALH